VTDAFLNWDLQSESPSSLVIKTCQFPKVKIWASVSATQKLTHAEVRKQEKVWGHCPKTAKAIKTIPSLATHPFN